MRLSKHFALEEFTLSQTAERFFIDNTPPKDALDNLILLCHTILEPARVALGPLRISSGYRCVQLNERVGGSRTSAHVEGYAADVIPITVSKMELARWLVRNVIFDQVILEFGTKTNPAWIHVSASPRARKQVLRILRGTGYVPVDLK